MGLKRIHATVYDRDCDQTIINLYPRLYANAFCNVCGDEKKHIASIDGLNKNGDRIWIYICRDCMKAIGEAVDEKN